MWSERRPRPLVSFARHPVGVVLGLSCFSVGLRLLDKPPGFETSLSWKSLLTGVMALAVLALVAQVLVSYLRHANAEVVFTNRRAMWREAGRTRQLSWSSVQRVELHSQSLILCSEEAYQDEVVGRFARAFVETSEDSRRLVCPLADPPRVWTDLLAQGVVDLELAGPPEAERQPLGPALGWLALGVFLLAGAMFVLVELRVSLGGWGLLLGLVLLALGIPCTIPALRRAHERWVQPDDPGA